MVMVSVLKLILNYDISPGAVFFRKNINTKITDTRFLFFQRDVNADSFT